MSDLTINDFLPLAELLAQLAEEASELSQAALKLRRVLDGTNPTPTGYEMAKKNLIEEAADVLLCMSTVHALDNRELINQIIDQKRRRWINRLTANRRAEDDARDR